MAAFPIRLMCLTMLASSVINGYVAIQREEWRRLLDGVALGLVAIVLFLATSDTGALRAPRIGTRPIRLAFYAVTFGISLMATMGSPLQPEAPVFSYLSTLLLITVVLAYVV